MGRRGDLLTEAAKRIRFPANQRAGGAMERGQNPRGGRAALSLSVNSVGQSRAEQSSAEGDTDTAEGANQVDGDMGQSVPVWGAARSGKAD